MRPPLLEQLRLFARRLRGVRLASGVGWGLVAALVTLLAGVWLDLLWETPPQLRVAVGYLALVIAMGLVGFGTVGALRLSTARALARRLDRVGGTGGEILSAIDLLQEKRPSAPLTAGLAELAVDRAARRTQTISLRQAIPARPIRLACGTLCLLAGVVLAISLSVPGLAQTQWLRFTDPYGDHPPYSRVRYEVEPGDVQVLYGSGLEVRVKTHGPMVERLQFVFQPEGAGAEALPMFREPDGAWRASLTNVTTPGRYFVRSGAGRSQRYRLAVLTAPQLERVRFRITPSAYTNLPAYNGPLPQGGLMGLPGTRVQVWVKSNRPLSGGSIDVPTPPRAESVSDRRSPVANAPGSWRLQPLSPGSQEVTGSFEIRASGRLRLQIVDVDGQAGKEPFSASVFLLSDERPTVRLVEPPAISLATPSITLPVVIAAEDDYGISSIEVFRSLNDSRPIAMTVPIPTPPRTRATVTVLLPLASYGLEAGDEIKLFARALDNDPAGPKGAESPLAVVRIIAQAEFERLVRARRGLELLQAKYREAQRHLEALGQEMDRLEKKLKDNPAAGKDARGQMRELALRMRARADAMRRAAEQPLDYDLDRHLKEQLERLSRQLEDAANELERVAADEKLSREQLALALAKMSERLQGEQKKLRQEALDPLEHLAALQPVIEDAARFVRLYERQRALAERLKSLPPPVAGPSKGPATGEGDDPKVKSRMHELQAEQEELRQDLIKLLDELEDHAAQLPDDKKLDELRQSMLDFVDEVRKSGATQAMAECESSLESFQGRRGQEAAAKAADILDKFVKKCTGEEGLMAQGQRGLKFQPKLSAGLGDTVEQLLRDAGLEVGDGQGGASGQSAQRNSLENVGLYGQVPGIESLPGNGRGGEAQQGTTGRSPTGGPDTGALTAGARGTSSTTASGAAERNIPPAYRRRVAEYFQRVADETGGK